MSDPSDPSTSPDHRVDLPPVPAGIPQASWGMRPTSQPPRNPVLGVLLAIAVAAGGAGLWAVIEGITGYEVSFIGLGIGVGVGTVLHRHCASSQTVSVGAATITAVGILGGHVVGTWARVAHQAHVSFALARRTLSVGTVIHRGSGGLFWLFVALGVFYAFTAAGGRRYRGFGFGGRRPF